LLSQAQPNPFSIEISSEHENVLRMLNGGEGLTEWLQRAHSAGPHHNSKDYE
jgi:hypothetical protein